MEKGLEESKIGEEKNVVKISGWKSYWSSRNATMGSFPGLESNSNYWDMKLSTDLSPELLSSARSTKETAQKAMAWTSLKKRKYYELQNTSKAEKSAINSTKLLLEFHCSMDVEYGQWKA